MIKCQSRVNKCDGIFTKIKPTKRAFVKYKSVQAKKPLVTQLKLTVVHIKLLKDKVMIGCVTWSMRMLRQCDRKWTMYIVLY